MELIPEFVERKNGKRVEYLDPRLESILKPTTGQGTRAGDADRAGDGGYSLARGPAAPRDGQETRRKWRSTRHLRRRRRERTSCRARKRSSFRSHEKFRGLRFTSRTLPRTRSSPTNRIPEAHHLRLMAAKPFGGEDDTDRCTSFTRTRWRTA